MFKGVNLQGCKVIIVKILYKLVYEKPTIFSLYYN